MKDSLGATPVVTRKAKKEIVRIETTKGDRRAPRRAGKEKCSSLPPGMISPHMNARLRF